MQKESHLPSGELLSPASWLSGLSLHSTPGLGEGGGGRPWGLDAGGLRRPSQAGVGLLSPAPLRLREAMQSVLEKPGPAEQAAVPGRGTHGGCKTCRSASYRFLPRR